MNAKLKQAWDEWVATRPKAVQELARRFPLGTVIDDPTGQRYLVGYHGNEKPGLIVSKVNLYEDYQGAMAAKEYLCHECLDDLVLDNQTGAE